MLTRFFLWVVPTPAPTIKKFRTHHWMFGLVAIAISFAIHSLALYAVGLGLFVDELTYLLIGGRTHEDNYSYISLLGTTLLVILVYIFRESFVVYF